MNTQKTTDIVKGLVRNDIIYCVSSLISALSNNDEYRDELTDVLSKPRTINETDYQHEAEELCWVRTKGGFFFDSSEYENYEEAAINQAATRHEDWQELCEYESIDVETDDYDDALEHWIVSAWLAEKLLNKQEMVIEFQGLWIWGRTCSGQSIEIDGVIHDIAAAL